MEPAAQTVKYKQLNFWPKRWLVFPIVLYNFYCIYSDLNVKFCKNVNIIVTVNLGLGLSPHNDNNIQTPHIFLNHFCVLGIPKRV